MNSLRPDPASFEGTIRALTAQDIGAALELSIEAGWNQTAQDWRMLLELESEGCFALECKGCLAATATLVCWGQLAWLGMVLTRSPYRGRGFARRLVGATLQLADARGIKTVKLDATAQGQPLYESFGFRAERPIERWSGTGGDAGDAMSPKRKLGDSARLDREAFGADRSRLLALLSRESPAVAAENAYGCHRVGSVAHYLGPCVARSREIAEGVVAACLSSTNGRWFWDLFPDNYDAVHLAKQFGFQRERQLLRMHRGPELSSGNNMIYAIAGFELG